MAVTQVAFEIPAAIQKGIDKGIFFRFGGVIRDQAGHIVTHLKEVELPKPESSSKKMLEFAKNNKYILIGTAIATAVAATITYVVVKNKKNEEIKVPKCIVDFNEAFMAYIDAIKNKTVSEDKIDAVMSALDEINKNQNEGKLDITFSVENASLLIDMVKSYTVSFAKANSFNLLESDCDDTNEIISLQRYLNIQKQIFAKCA